MSSYDYKNYAAEIWISHLLIYIPTLPRCHFPELNYYQLQKAQAQAQAQAHAHVHANAHALAQAQTWAQT